MGKIKQPKAPGKEPVGDLVVDKDPSCRPPRTVDLVFEVEYAVVNAGEDCPSPTATQIGLAIDDAEGQLQTAGDTFCQKGKCSGEKKCQPVISVSSTRTDTPIGRKRGEQSVCYIPVRINASLDCKCR